LTLQVGAAILGADFGLPESADPWLDLGIGGDCEARGTTPMTTTTKKDLIDRIADETDQKRTVVKKTVQCFLDNVIRELGEGHRLEFRDFGVFEIRERAPRMAQNPKTLERVPVPAKKTVKFKVGRLMKEALEVEFADGEADDGALR
jgi:integration host factor subunit beta